MKNSTLWRSLISVASAVLIFNAGSLFATTVALVGGQGKAGYNDGDTYKQALFSMPSGMAMDLDGNLWVADAGNNLIRLISAPETSQSGGSGTFTFAPVVTNLIVKPIGVALDDFGNVYILDYGNGNNGNILEYDTDYGDIEATNAMNLTNAAAMALDAVGNIYVTVNNNQILKITAPGVSNVVVTITNAGTSLKGLVVKQVGTYAGWLAVCDAGRNGIYLVNPGTGIVITNAGFHGAGDFPSGTDISSSQDAKFNQPMGVAETGDGSLIVTDYGNNRVKVVKASDGGVTNLYGVVTSDWDPSPYPGFSSYLNPSTGAPETVKIPDAPGGVAAREPNGVIFTSDGTVFVTEEYYDIIREVISSGLPVPPPPPPPAPTTPAGVGATGGYGQVNLTWLSSANATNYDIERSSGSGYNIIATTSATSYTDTTGIQDGMTYSYVLQAVGAGGESPVSAQVSATPLFSPPPTIESVATNTISYTAGSVTLTWSVSAGATTYVVERSSGTNFSQIATVSAPTTTYTDSSGLVNGNTYYYEIAAENGGGTNPTNSPQVAVTLPSQPVPDPQIGWVTYPLNLAEDQFLSVFNPGSPAGNTFNNDVDLVIVDPSGVQIHFNTGNTTIVTNVPDPTSSSTTAQAGYANNNTQSTVETTWAINGLIQPSPSGNLMIKAIGEQQGHPNSDVVAALFQFVVGQPQAIGTNAGQFVLTNITAGSSMYYTYAYNTNLPGYPSATNPAATAVTNGETLALNFPQGTTNLTFEAVGYRANYAPSAVYTNYFSSSNFMANTVSFGFASGPGSSQFVASPGQSFVLPVGLSMLASSPSIYGLQFYITLTNLTGPAVNPYTIDFGSLIGKPDPKNPGYYDAIPPYMFISTNQPNNDPNAIPYPDTNNWYQSLQFIDANNEELLGLGWLEIYGRTNLYNTLNQNLLTYPILTGNDPYPPSQSIVGGYTFGIPANAISGDVYQVQIGRPSATAFPGGLSANPYGVPVGIVAPVDTNLVGPGSVNALKNITIGQLKYLVGDVHPANWFNAGDFGSSNLDNLDVERVFDFAVYPVASPPYRSDLFDALDSCGNIGVLDGATGYYTNANNYAYYTNISYSITNYTIYENTNGVVSSNSAPAGPFISVTYPVYLTTYFLTVNEEYTNTYIITNANLFITTNVVPVPNLVNVPIPPGNTTLFSGNDTTINQIAFGDGVLDVCDVYVTFRRSLDTNNLLWFQRFWTNGVRVATANWAPTFIPNPAVQTKSVSGKIANATSNPSVSPTSITNTPLVNFVAGDFQATAGQTIQIPVTAAIFGSYPLRVAMLNLSVVPLDGSPALTTPISFAPGAALGAPYLTTSSGNGNYAAAWLDSTIAGLSNNATIGTLTITIPANATGMSAYAIHFDHASGSPNGLASFPYHTLTGLITLSSRTNSSYGDGIPDSWRLRYFGTTNNLLSVSNADADGTGMNNWQKYVACLNPVDPTSVLSPYYAGTDQKMAQNQQDAVISWPSVFGAEYIIQRSPTLFPPVWTSISTNTGTGNYMEIHDSPTNPYRFYRVLVP